MYPVPAVVVVTGVAPVTGAVTPAMAASEMTVGAGPKARTGLKYKGYSLPVLFWKPSLKNWPHATYTASSEEDQYTLATNPDAPDPELIAPLLSHTVAFDVQAIPLAHLHI